MIQEHTRQDLPREVPNSNSLKDLMIKEVPEYSPKHSPRISTNKDVTDEESPYLSIPPTPEASATTEKPARYKLPRKETNGDVLVGTAVKEGHHNYMLMYDMLTGIRISVSRCQAKAHRELVSADYEAAHKLAFDVTGNELTPSSKYDFKFKDYCPYVFRMVRDIFHVDAADYLMSLTGKYVLSELASSGKSGSFFYYSQDYRFIIKTIHRSEHKFILKILEKYYEHVRNNPHTLISRIFGLHRVKLPGKGKIHFVVMGNVFPPNKDIHEIYDLKGSIKGRSISEEKAKNPRSVMKDLNWLERKKKIYVGPEKRNILQSQLQTDVDFLMDNNIMDYSLLIGIHDMTRGNADHIRDTTLSVFQPNARTLSRRATATSRNLKSQIERDPSVRNDLIQLGPSSSKLPDQAPPERRYCVFYLDEGGFGATDENNLPLKEIYYIGLIDIFTYYTPAKRTETFLRTLTDPKQSFSAVHPAKYGIRFMDFMKNEVFIPLAAGQEAESLESQTPKEVYNSKGSERSKEPPPIIEEVINNE